jgi:hypothetical protein
MQTLNEENAGSTAETNLAAQAGIDESVKNVRLASTWFFGIAGVS